MTLSPGPLRRLIVNADDFGQSDGINRGVALCHETGILTSASLMVRWPAARAAAAYARAHPDLAIGLHLDLGEWTCENGCWFPLYEVVPLDDEDAVRCEIARQLEAFRAIVGRDPTHLDSHQHAHQAEPVRTIALELASTLGVPLRGCDPAVTYVGSFYGQGRNGQPLQDVISVEHLIRLLEALPDAVTELGCHPAIGRDVQSLYLHARADEVAVLCDPRVRNVIQVEHIELCSFRELVIQPRASRGRTLHRPQ